MASSMRMRSFLLLAAFLPIVPTVAEVVDSVSKCPGFLLDETLPQIGGITDGKNNIQDQNRYKLICQTYKNKKRFLTLYDTKNKIPVFSAYKFKKTTKGRPNQSWMIEPQLEGGDNKNMENSDDTKSYLYQAVEKDYKVANEDHQIGHLYPVSHAPEEDDKRSTFTLTNAVPQNANLNIGKWMGMEKKIKSTMEKCINEGKEGFAVVGAVASKNDKLNNWVNIPEMLWAAYCCYDSSKKKCKVETNWSENKNEDEDKNKDKTPRKEHFKGEMKDLNSKMMEEDNIFKVFPKQKEFLKLTQEQVKQKRKNGVNGDATPPPKRKIDR